MKTTRSHQSRRRHAMERMNQSDDHPQDCSDAELRTAIMQSLETAKAENASTATEGKSSVSEEGPKASPVESDDTTVKPTVSKQAAAATAPDSVVTPVVSPAPEKAELRARFITHLTLGDEKPILPGATITKVWRMRNEGPTAWPTGTRLIHVGASRMDGPVDGVPVSATAPGDTADISVTLRAPDAPGRHVGYWRLITPDGKRFGHRVWADVFVENTNAADIIAESGEGKDDSTVAGKDDSTAAALETSPTPPPSAPTIVEAVSFPDVPPSVVDVPDKWVSQISCLAEMGLADTKRNLELLERFNGNIHRVVGELL